MNCLLRAMLSTRNQALLAFVFSLLLSACNTSYRAGHPTDNQWVVLPVVAATEAASIQVERLLIRTLIEQGIIHSQHPPKIWINDQTKINKSAHKLRNALQWAQQHSIKLGLTCTVENWDNDYKNRPNVTLTLKLLNIPSNTILWATTGSSEGRHGESVSDIAGNLIQTLLATQEPRASRGLNLPQ